MLKTYESSNYFGYYLYEVFTLKIKCPKCKQKFDWEGPSPAVTIVRGGINIRTNHNDDRPKYSVKCPNCQVRLNITP